MQISLSKFVGALSAIAALALISGFVYFSYLVIFVGTSSEVATSIASVNSGSFGPKIQKAIAALSGGSSKISLKKKDLAFTETPLFKSFRDPPEDVPLSDSRGRPNPFVPYVAP